MNEHVYLINTEAPINQKVCSSSTEIPATVLPMCFSSAAGAWSFTTGQCN